MKAYSVQSILDWLTAKGLLKNRAQAEAFILCHENINKLPAYIHVLMGIGAFLGSCCIIGLLVATEIISFNDEKSLLISGLSCMVFAFILYYILRYQRTLLNSFALQAALIFMVVGKILFVTGFAKAFQYPVTPINKDWMISFGLLVVTLLTYYIFPLWIDRFLSTLGLLSSLIFNMLYQFDTTLYFFLFYCGLLLCTGFLFFWPKKTLFWNPFSYSCIIALCLCAIYLVSPLYGADFAGKSPTFVLPALYFNIASGFGLILLTFMLAGRHNRTELFILFACVGLLILSLISNVGILLSIGFLILGYAKHEDPLIVLGGIFLALFLIYFYYSLPYTLEYKAGILAASGLVLLASNYVLKIMKWNMEQ